MKLLGFTLGLKWPRLLSSRILHWGGGKMPLEKTSNFSVQARHILYRESQSSCFELNLWHFKMLVIIVLVLRLDNEWGIVKQKSNDNRVTNIYQGLQWKPNSPEPILPCYQIWLPDLQFMATHKFRPTGLLFPFQLWIQFSPLLVSLLMVWLNFC